MSGNLGWTGARCLSRGRGRGEGGVTAAERPAIAATEVPPDTATMTDETPAPPGRKRRLYGLVAEAVPYFDVADENVAGFLRPKKRAMVDIFVSKESLPRALDTA